MDGARYGITYDEPSIQEQYYYLNKAEIESILGVKKENIDISENFIINFQKRYVFSETPIEIETKNNEKKTIYCLYELDEEEQVIEYKVDNSRDGILKIEVVEKTLYYQKIKLTTLRGTETKIKQVYYEVGNTISTLSDEDTSEENNLKTIDEGKNYFDEITGLETNTVYIKIKQSGQYTFTAEDLVKGYYSEQISIQLHEPPVLENNMVPFIATEEKDEGIVYSQDKCTNINQWYDYYGSDPKKYATAVIASESNSSYQDKAGKQFDIAENMTVRVWIPKAMQNLASYISTTEFANKTGVWVEAKWQSNTDPSTGGNWEPLGWTVNSISINDNNNGFTIGTSGSGATKYYYKIDNSDYQESTIASISTEGLSEGQDITVYAREYSEEKLIGQSKQVTKKVPSSRQTTPTETTPEIPTITSMQISNDGKSIQTFVSGSQNDLTYTYKIGNSEKPSQRSSIYYNEGNEIPAGAIQVTVTRDGATSNASMSKTVVKLNNLIRDGGFEGSGWRGEYISYNNSNKHSGNYSLKIQSNSESETYAYSSNNIYQEQNHLYYTSIWACTTEDTSIDFYFPEDEPRFFGANVNSSNWTKLSGINGRSKWLTGNQTFRIDNNVGNKELYIDDLILFDLTRDFNNAGVTNIDNNRAKTLLDELNYSAGSSWILY